MLIPIYNRTSVLKWVLKSVAESPLENEVVKVCIVNNHPGTKEIVDEIISEFQDTVYLKWIVVHREVSMTHVKSWYSAVADHADENEVVLMLGDDDFMLPWGAMTRFEALSRTKADMLLTSFVDRLYFYKGSGKFWLTTDYPSYEKQPKTARKWCFTPGVDPEASFVSNHSYRYTEKFKQGLALAFDWCEKQYWLGEKERMGMLPLYLSYAISQVGGNVYALNSKCVIRGAIVPDVYLEEYAGGGSTQLFLLCAFDTFSNSLLENYSDRLQEVANFYKPRAKTFDPGLLNMKNVTFSSVTKLYKRTGISYFDLVNINSIKFLTHYLIKRVFKLSGYKLRKMQKEQILPHISTLFGK